MPKPLLNNDQKLLVCLGKVGRWRSWKDGSCGALNGGLKREAGFRRAAVEDTKHGTEALGLKQGWEFDRSGVGIGFKRKKLVVVS
jgi:hypothetical protein